MTVDLSKLIKYRALLTYYRNTIKCLEESIEITKVKIRELQAKLTGAKLELQGKKITLTENVVLCGEDFRFFRGVPKEIEFTINNISNNIIRLIGPGHGAKDDYGAGAISANLDNINQYLLKKDKDCP